MEEEATTNLCTPHQVTGAFFSYVKLQPLVNAKIVCLSQPALALIGLSSFTPDDDSAAMLSASQPISNSRAYAHCYAGHQFGMFAGQLGDGAATAIGEVTGNPQRFGESYGFRRWELQFKGAGRTPFSRCAEPLLAESK